MDKAERRRKLQATKEYVKGGVDLGYREVDQIIGLMRVLHDLLRTSMQRGSIIPLAHWLCSNVAQTQSKLASDTPVACRSRCSHCCKMWVDASPVEIFYISKSLIGHPRVVAAAAVLGAVALTGPMDFDARAQFVYPCPMLIDNACSVYARRPLACRAAVSIDAEVCGRAYHLETDEQIPAPMPYLLMGFWYRFALTGAMKRAGLRYSAIELNSGLHIALSVPTAEMRWLAGDDPFNAAQSPPGGDMFDDPNNYALYDAAFAEF